MLATRKARDSCNLPGLSGHTEMLSAQATLRQHMWRQGLRHWRAAPYASSGLVLRVFFSLPCFALGAFAAPDSRTLDTSYVTVRVGIDPGTPALPISLIDGVMSVTNGGVLVNGIGFASSAQLGSCASFIVSDRAQIPGGVSQATFTSNSATFSLFATVNFTAPETVAQFVIGTAGEAINGTMSAVLPSLLTFTRVVTGGLTNNPVCPQPCNRYDLNGDGVIDIFDVSILLGDWGACRPPATCYGKCRADFDNTGFVNALDNLQLLARWGQNCSLVLNK